MNEIIKKLREPFSADEIEWKIQVTAADKARGMAVAYVDSRAIQKRLDEVAGPFNWKSEYLPWQDKAQICRLYIYFADRNEWVTKCDGAENSDIEPVKGGLSDAFKRAASQWGIGRYLYDIDGIWVDVEAKGKSSAIKQNQYKVLETAYNQAVARIFGTQAVKPSAQKPTNPEPPKTSQAQPPAPPPSQPAQQQPKSKADYDYKIQSVKPSGSSSLLELVAKDGEVIKAYAKAADTLKTGVLLRNVQMMQKSGQYGPYNQINAYETAA
jgi:hypothetical protein